MVSVGVLSLTIVCTLSSHVKYDYSLVVLILNTLLGNENIIVKIA